MKIRVRVGVVLVHEDRILLVEHRRMGRAYWVLPGGIVRPSEDLGACGVREVREETGLLIAVEGLLYVADVISRTDDRHRLNLIFRGRILDGDLSLRGIPPSGIERPEFVPVTRLPGLRMLPPLGAEMAKDIGANFAEPPRYLGNLWMPLEP